MPGLLPEIALFWLCVHVVLWLLRRMPGSRIAGIAFAWQGPFPVEGERKSSYYRRKVKFAVGWLLQILFVGALVTLLLWLLPRSEAAETFALVTAFALTIGAGMAILGALLAGLVSAKATLIGPDPEFHHSPSVDDDIGDDQQI